MRAGFVAGGAKSGTGLEHDCVRPIVEGRPQPMRAGIPLPRINPRVIFACRATNPHFGEGGGQGPRGQGRGMRPGGPPGGDQGGPDQGGPDQGGPDQGGPDQGGAGPDQGGPPPGSGPGGRRGWREGRDQGGPPPGADSDDEGGPPPGQGPRGWHGGRGGDQGGPPGAGPDDDGGPPPGGGRGGWRGGRGGQDGGGGGTAMDGPCGRIVAACERAGFVRGGAKSGFGLLADCVRPLLKGTPQPMRARRALPRINPRVIMACRESNPNFGQGHGGRGQGRSGPSGPPDDGQYRDEPGGPDQGGPPPRRGPGRFHHGPPQGPDEGGPPPGPDQDGPPPGPDKGGPPPGPDQGGPPPPGPDQGGPPPGPDQGGSPPPGPDQGGAPPPGPDQGGPPPRGSDHSGVASPANVSQGAMRETPAQAATRLSSLRQSRTTHDTPGMTGVSSLTTNTAATGTAPPENAPAPAARAAANDAQQQTPAPEAGTTRRPNIVFILTDDMSMNLLQYMPRVLQMQKKGVTFSNYFVTDSLCCPSRASIFTGRYPHDTGVFTNIGDDGGYSAFRKHGLEQKTFAVALSAVGYRTALLGKYLNKYQPAYGPAPGWTSWAVAGNGYPEFHYSLNVDGKVVYYGDNPSDYMTDVLSGIGSRFIRASGNTPFLLEVSTFAPHRPFTPAPRDADAFPDLGVPRTAAYDVAPDANAPDWLKQFRPLSARDMTRLDYFYRKRAQSMLAVDAMIGQLQAAVAAIGQQDNTYFIFSSDNGFHMGEYRMMTGKMTAFDTDIHVPLIVTGPGVPAGHTVDAITENIDLCPTFEELAGAPIPAGVDGHSLVPFLRGQDVSHWRTAALVEHHGPVAGPDDPDEPEPRGGNPPTYGAIRTANATYVEYVTGEKEYYDNAADPYQLHNVYSSLDEGTKASLHALLHAMENCHDAKSCLAAERPDRSVQK